MILLEQLCGTLELSAREPVFGLCSFEISVLYSYLLR